MRADFSAIEGGYLRDLLDQPRALRDTVAGLEAPEGLDRIARRARRGDFRALILTGMGSSFHALHPLLSDLVEHGYPAVAVETSELIHGQRGWLSMGPLVVAVSQSGRSAEIVRLLDDFQGAAPLLAVTNTPDSPLATRADAAILIRAGDERSVSCKTYVASLAALRSLGDILCERDPLQSRRELGSAAPLADLYLKRWKDHAGGFLELLEGVRHMFLLGRGASLAAAGDGALIVKEAARFPAEGMSCAAFRHGPLEMLGDGVLSMIFAGDPETRDLNRGLLRDIRERGGRAEWVGEDAAFAPCALPATPLSIAPILEILPVQMATLALALRAGREPGRFTLAAKVTTEE